MKSEPVAFRRGKLQGVAVMDTKGNLWVGDQCFKVGSKYEIFSLPTDSPAAKRAIAAYNAYLERKAQKQEKVAEEARRRKDASEERENLLANLEPGMYLAVRHYAGQGRGDVYVVGRVDRIEHKKRTGRRVIYVAKYFRKSGVWDKPRPLSDFDFGWLLTETHAQAVISGKKPLYGYQSTVMNTSGKIERRHAYIVHEPLEPLED